MAVTSPSIKTEAPEFSAFVRRILRAMGRRAASGDLESLAAMRELRRELDAITAQAARAANASGYSWGDIARELGVSRQYAHRTWAGAEGGQL